MFDAQIEIFAWICVAIIVILSISLVTKLKIPFTKSKWMTAGLIWVFFYGAVVLFAKPQIAEKTLATMAQQTPSTNSSKSTQPCAPRKFKDWSNLCSQIIGYTNVQISQAEVATKLTLSYDGERIRLSGIVPEWYHQKFFTNIVPVFAVIDGKRFVEERYFFNGRFPCTVKVGDTTVKLAWDGMPHWIASATNTKLLIRAFRAGSIAEIQYAHLGRGKGQTANVSLMGFTAALRAFEGKSEKNNQKIAVSITPDDAVRLVAKKFAPNKLGVKQNELRTVQNPYGTGIFVYVPGTRFRGIERKFVWFVVGKTAIKLNGAASHTP